eukprot:TRINITY_DN9444_c0_g1_i1.p2 TRINITY_DN9444_c0_g1~~TRINITY_DN9444_c0_g1_i1.p2  ORF type:complete len:118 (-),score=35.39 TRINITY_DN9444_c0_g1_i1:470-823(-)
MGDTTTTIKPTTTTTSKPTTTTAKNTTTTTKKTTTTHKPLPHFSASLTLSKVQLDAFRTNVSSDAFQAESMCDNGSPGNDLIPIIVGCVLAAMVVIVLVAYLIGRRYQAATPYQNLD